MATARIKPLFGSSGSRPVAAAASSSASSAALPLTIDPVYYLVRANEIIQTFEDFIEWLAFQRPDSGKPLLPSTDKVPEPMFVWLGNWDPNTKAPMKPNVASTSPASWRLCCPNRFGEWDAEHSIIVTDADKPKDSRLFADYKWNNESLNQYRQYRSCVKIMSESVPLPVPYQRLTSKELDQYQWSSADSKTATTAASQWFRHSKEMREAIHFPVLTPDAFKRKDDLSFSRLFYHSDSAAVHQSIYEETEDEDKSESQQMVEQELRKYAAPANLDSKAAAAASSASAAAAAVSYERKKQAQLWLPYPLLGFHMTDIDSRVLYKVVINVARTGVQLPVRVSTFDYDEHLPILPVLKQLLWTKNQLSPIGELPMGRITLRSQAPISDLDPLTQIETHNQILTRFVQTVSPPEQSLTRPSPELLARLRETPLLDCQQFGWNHKHTIDQINAITRNGCAIFPYERVKGFIGFCWREKPVGFYQVYFADDNKDEPHVVSEYDVSGAYLLNAPYLRSINGYLAYEPSMSAPLSAAAAAGSASSAIASSSSAASSSK